VFLFSWQHPDPDSAAFEESYNGAALDNVAMFPDDSLLEGATDDGSMAGPAYLAWLRSGLPPTANIESISGGSSGSSGGTNSNPVCAIRPWASGPYFKPNALRYLDSVPFTHRAPRRWGWKNPKVIYLPLGSPVCSLPRRSLRARGAKSVGLGRGPMGAPPKPRIGVCHSTGGIRSGFGGRQRTVHDCQRDCCSAGTSEEENTTAYGGGYQY
jgi:hypothetical protein